MTLISPIPVIDNVREMILKPCSIHAAAFVLFSCFVFGGCKSLERVSREYYAQHTDRIYAVVDVDVISMENEFVSRHQSIIIKNDRILEIGNEETTRIPEEARVISGEGKYALPGFIDMHVHISDDGDLLKFLKYGVTTVRHMADVPWWAKAMGFSDVLSLRKKQRNGEIAGPEIFTCGYSLDGDPPVSPMNKKITTPGEAKKEIAKEHKAGYDFIKIYDNLSREAFDAILEIAGVYHIPVVGHVPYSVSIGKVLRSSYLSIEHLTGYIDNNAAEFIIPEQGIGEYAAKTAASGIYNCPTLVIWDNLPPENKFEELEKDPDYKYLPWQLRWLWKRTLSKVYEITYPDKNRYAVHMMEISKRMLEALYEEGAPLLIGTDADFLGVYPGISALREMELFGEAGVPAIDILRAATVAPARALGRQGEIGTLASGKIANLVVLEANPLEDIKNVYLTSGVFVRGRWMDKRDIERMLEDIYNGKR